MAEKEKTTEVPTREQVEAERERLQYGSRFRRTMRNVIAVLIVVAAAAVLVSTLVLPVFRIYGSSMSPTLQEGDMVVGTKSERMEQGDLIAFYFNNKILIKRVIATAGEWVDIDEDGTVYVNGEELDEPYLDQKAFGECDIELPYQVSDGQVFVMGDHRDVSIDSRSTSIGCVSQEQVAGRLFFKLWPLSRIGAAK